MKASTYLSSYLYPRAGVHSAGLIRRMRFRLRLISLSQRRPSRRTITGLAMWVAVLICGSWAADARDLTGPAAGLARSTSAFHASVALASSEQPAATLPGGPTGQLLPPGSTSPYGTYANSYTRGQCTWYVASRRPIPSGWGNARTWYGRAAAAGWKTGSIPAVGAVAWTSAGYYGHVAIVEQVSGNQVQVAEMNYYGAYRVDTRWASASSFKYIY